MRRRKKKRHIKIVIGILLCFLLTMTVGYAAFSSNYNINANGIINEVKKLYPQNDKIYLFYDKSKIPNGTVWEDISGNGHNSKLSGFSASSYSGDHLIFDGVNDFIDTGVSQLDFGQSITFSTVVNIKSLSLYRGLWGFHEGGAGMGIAAQAANNNYMTFTFYTGIRAGAPVTIDMIPYMNKKIQIVVTMQGGVGLSLYINGVFKGTGSTKDNLVPYTKEGANFIIGMSYPANDRYFLGDLYNFIVYKTVLTNEEISENFLTDKTRYGL